MRYKTIMLGRNSYAKLALVKKAMRKKSGLKLSFEDLILELIGRKLELSPLDDRLKLYIQKVVTAISDLDGIEGILLFGSIAKGTYNEYSDIDIAVFTSMSKWETFEKVQKTIRKFTEEGYAIMDQDLPSRISPIILDRKDAKTFRPFYFDLADYGIILYERGNMLTDFVDSMKWKKHRREIIGGVEVVTW